MPTPDPTSPSSKARAEAPTSPTRAEKVDATPRPWVIEEFIVRAVNAHDELVEALRAVDRYIGTIPPKLLTPGLKRQRITIRAALAKVEGE